MKQPRATPLSPAAGLLRLLLALCLGVLCVLPQADATASVSPLLLDREGAESTTPLSGHMEVLEDRSHSLDLSGAIGARGYRSVPGVPGEGYTDAAFWVRFRLVRREGFPRDAWLRLGPPTQDSMRVYVQRAGSSPVEASSYTGHELGMETPADRRPIAGPDPAVPIGFGGGDTLSVYVRLASSTPVQLEAAVLGSGALARESHDRVLSQSAYLGTVAVASLMSLMIFVSVRQREFLYFSLYVASVLLAAMAMRGMHTVLLGPLSHLAGPLLAKATLGTTFAFFALLAGRVLSESAPVWSIRTLRLLAAWGLLDALASMLWAHSPLQPLTNVAALGFLGVLLMLGVRLARPLHAGTLMLLGAFTLNTLLYAAFFLQNLGVMAWSPRILDLLQLFSLLHIVVMFTLLVNRSLNTERELQKQMRNTEFQARAIAENKTYDLRRHRDELELSLLAEQRSAERVRRFLSMVSHEYRTPLAIIQGNLDIIARRTAAGESEEHSALQAMRRAAGRLLEVMEAALGRSRLLETTASGGTGRMRLRAYVEEQAESARMLWPKCRIETECDAGAESVEGDLLLLGMALFNLLDNAVKYSPGGSAVRVRCRTEAGVAEISVYNETRTSPCAETDALFEKFRRGGNTADREGSGIGLWLVHEVVGRHGGSVEMECGEEGRVRVEMRIPLAGDVR